MNQRTVLALLVACMALVGALAPPAFGSATPEHANCLALILSNSDPGDVGDSASSNAKDPEARPLGINVISFTAHLSAADCGE